MKWLQYRAVSQQGWGPIKLIYDPDSRGLQIACLPDTIAPTYIQLMIPTSKSDAVWNRYCFSLRPPLMLPLAPFAPRRPRAIDPQIPGPEWAPSAVTLIALCPSADFIFPPSHIGPYPMLSLSPIRSFASPCPHFGLMSRSPSAKERQRPNPSSFTRERVELTAMIKICVCPLCGK